MSDFRVLDAAVPVDHAAWVDAWRSWPDHEVMAHPEFALLFARPQDRVIALLGRDGERSVLYPLILRPLSAEAWARPGEDRWDAATPYGYGGPYAWGPAGDDAPFWAAHAAWCREAKLVTTFGRLSLFPDQLAAISGTVEERLPNIVVPLDGGPAAIWAGYESKVRKWVKTAEEAGLTVEADRTGARLEEFLAIYKHTMTRNEATDWYFFPREFFQRIIDKLPEQFVFFHTIKDGKSVSTDLVLCSRRYVYYFLGGTLEEAYDLGPNYLLKHRIALWAAAEGKKGYVLGGGYELGDGLFRYKRAYARKGETPFKVSCLVHDEQAVAELIRVRAEHESRAGRTWAPKPLYFPAYRA